MATVWVVIGAAAFVLAIAVFVVGSRRRKRSDHAQTPKLTWREKRAQRRDELWGRGGLADQAGGFEIGSAGAYDNPNAPHPLAVTNTDDDKLRKWF